MEVPAIAYIILILTVIGSVVMVNVAKYGWRSRGWTWFFALLGAVSMMVLMFLVYPAL
ncbi:MAG: hypothetical protein JXA22_06910 [Candidatus Thermoplasmatota archaeon]|nr:hypothetical protein [Candidatus Thermoplasmatota archaeon]